MYLKTSTGYFICFCIIGHLKKIFYIRFLRSMRSGKDTNIPPNHLKLMLWNISSNIAICRSKICWQYIVMDNQQNLMGISVEKHFWGPSWFACEQKALQTKPVSSLDVSTKIFGTLYVLLETTQ